MAYNKIYDRIKWVNESDGKITPLGALNLNKMDIAIDQLDQRSVELDKKIDTEVSQLSNEIASPLLDNYIKGLIGLTIYSNDYLRYGIQYFWRNSHNKILFIRFVGYDGTSWVNIGEVNKTVELTETIEKIEVAGKFSVILNYSIMDNVIDLSSIIGIKEECIDRSLFANAELVQNAGTSVKNVMSQDIVTKMLDYPFERYYEELSGIMNIKLYSTDYEKFGVSYFQHNVGTNETYIRLMGYNGTSWVTITDYLRTATPTNRPTIETITLYKAGVPVCDFVINWNKVTSGLNWTTLTGIKKSCLELGAKSTSLADNDIYFVKDTTSRIVSVDPNGNGDFTTIAEAYASITDSSVKKQYEVVLYPGVYNEVNLIPPPFVHTHGIQPNTVIVTSEGKGGTLPVFDLRQYTKLSNMKIISDTGYCIHYDVSLNYAFIVCENLHCIKKTYGEIIGGGAFYGGTSFLWKSCIFEMGTVNCHTNSGNANFYNTVLRFIDCSLIDSVICLGSVGGFGNFVCEISGLYTRKGRNSLQLWDSSLRTVADEPETYFANRMQWQVIGSNNKNFKTALSASGEGVQFETINVNENITLSGTALKDLFGVVNYKKGWSRIKGKANGTLLVKDEKAGLQGYSECKDVFQMWKRLGDCSTTNKTISVTVGDTTQTYTFNQNYEALQTSESEIIEAVNDVITIAQLKKYTVDIPWENINTDEKQRVNVQSGNGILAGEWVTIFGTLCNENTDEFEIMGVALEDGAYGEQIQVWCGNIVPYTESDGEYGIGADSKLSVSAEKKIGKIINNYFYRY